MLRLTWWKPRRIIIACILAALLIPSAIWISGRETIEIGEPWEVAREKMLKIGAMDVTKNCGRFQSIGAPIGQPNAKLPNTPNAYYQMSDGSVIFLWGYSKDDDDPVVVREIEITPDGEAFWRKENTPTEKPLRLVRRHDPWYPLKWLKRQFENAERK